MIEQPDHEKPGWPFYDLPGSWNEPDFVRALQHEHASGNVHVYVSMALSVMPKHLHCTLFNNILRHPVKYGWLMPDPVVYVEPPAEVMCDSEPAPEPCLTVGALMKVLAQYPSSARVERADSEFGPQSIVDADYTKSTNTVCLYGRQDS